MHPVRPDGLVDARTERVAAGPSVDLEHLVTQARDRGLGWLRDQFLADPTAADHLPTLLAVMHLDLDRPGGGSQRLTEYRRVFSALRTTPEGRRAVQSLADDLASDLMAKTPPPASDRRLKVDAATENTPPAMVTPVSNAAVSRSLPSATDVPELDPAVAAELGFTELVRLGQGGFGTVYTARQPGVGNRLVAIKYTTARSREPQVLAALQHPNIMPVWSVHEYAGHRVFCMPLHGRTTLADVLRMIDRTKSLPATGAGFLSAASVTQAEAEMATARAAEAVEPEVALAEDAPEYESERRRLEKLGYVESVVRGVTRLADALSHAHRRRVVHLDIKPANILITDDGGFMILDFGLAYQNGLPASPEAGGTVRYMAPEQLTSFAAGQGVRPDPRMDLYALGLVFFELLTGRHPFADSLQPGVRREEWVAARHRHPPKVRRYNPTVPPGVEAIVLKMLHPDRTLRYQSAEQVLTDLTRHQDDQPLVHASNPSAWERFVKFRRRHPVFSVAVMAGLLAVMAVGGFWAARQEAERASAEAAVRETTEAQARHQAVLADQTSARIDAGSVQSTDARRRAVGVADKWRDAYGLGAADWRQRAGFARLSAGHQKGLTDALGEQALLAAHAERLNALGRPAGDAAVYLERAAEWNRRAEAVYAGSPPAAVGEQRAVLARLLGRTLPAVPAAAADGPTDLYLRAIARVAEADFRGAAAALEELERRDPQHAAGQFALGFVYQTTGRFYDAAERYQVAKALAARDYRPAFNRGILQLYHRHPEEAVSDLTAALDREPNLEDAYYLRAAARYQLAQQVGGQADRRPGEEKLAKALTDLDTAIELGGRRYRYLALRTVLRAKTGDATGADEDRDELERTTPQDEQDYISRGNRRIAEGQREEAMADFAMAAKLNPQYSTAWNNLAAQQSALGLNREAAESLSNVLQLMPDHAPTKYKRAVLLARLGDMDAAHAQIAGLTPPDADCWYQRAAVYAHGSVIDLNARDEAYRSLMIAARGGFADWDGYDKDDDFENVRDMPDFVKLRQTKGKLAE
jgi:serine/threonine protein kinase/tetratricopeptide (TPR) repeat protein